MFRLRIVICLLLLVVCSSVFAEQSLDVAPTFAQLQEENATLQRQVKRLESQVNAMRDELNRPGASRIVAGIGYIVGIFGVAGWLAVRKKSVGKG